MARPTLPTFPLLRATGLSALLVVSCLALRGLQPQIAPLVDLSQPMIVGLAGVLYVVLAGSQSVGSAMYGGAVAALLPAVLGLAPVVEEVVMGRAPLVSGVGPALLRGVASGICGSLVGYLLAQRARL